MAKKAKIIKSTLPKIDCDWVMIDVSNILFRTFFVARPGDDDITVAGMAAHTALTTINKYFKQLKPKRGMVMAFDRTSWRKAYTASDEAHPASKPYKGNRRQDMTPAQVLKFEQFLAHIKEFEELITNHTNVITLAGDNLEADDVIAGFCQINEGSDIVIISADSDLLQLKRYNGVRVISPMYDKELMLEDYDGDPMYYLFQKCMRGDPTDNIQSAFPRCRTARIKKAYDDPFERVQLFKETWTDEKNNTILVEDMFYENQKLIDLSQQPDNIRLAILTAVDAAMDKEHKFSMFHILKFCGKYELKRITENIDTYIPMLSH